MNSLFRDIFVALILAMSSWHVVARSVTAEEAARIASRHFAEVCPDAGLRAAPVVAGVEPWSVGDTVCMYSVQMAGGGWALVAAERRVTPVLAYSMSDTLDTDDLPPAMESLLNLYAKRIQRVMNLPDSVVPSVAGLRSQKKDVSVGSAVSVLWRTLLNIEGNDIAWGQSYGQDNSCINSYNALCPECSDNQCCCGHYAAGCGPVALAMLMRYWQWPPAARISQSVNKYGSPSDESSVSLYDWGIMPYALFDSTSKPSALAVAGLLRDCGYAGGSNYRTDYTLTWRREMVDALEAFHYHTDGWETRSGRDWEDRIRGEINQGRPVLYSALDLTRDSGSSSQSKGKGGHWFVIDGCEEGTGKFHVNWGWRGRRNGFFSLDNLNPTSEDVYDSFEAAIMGIYPQCGQYYQDFPIAVAESGTGIASDRHVETELKLPEGKAVLQVPSVTFLPGTEIAKGAKLKVLPPYKFCNSQGPGNNSVR